MTRRSKEWGEMSKRDQRAALATYFGSNACPPDATQSPPRDERAAPVQWEAAEQTAFLRACGALWWGRAPYLRAHVPENRGAGQSGERRGKRAKSAGQAPGWPDITVHVPPHCMLAIEFKAPGSRPKRDVPEEWWLEWVGQLQEDWRLRVNEPTRHGLRASQAEELQLLHRCGYRTLVAYSGVEAAAWAVMQVGLRGRPEVA